MPSVPAAVPPPMVSCVELVPPPELIQMSRSALVPTLFVPPRMIVVALPPPPMMRRSVLLVVPKEPLRLAVAP